ncbi:cytokine-like protein 1 [Suncus etruscus]|uniref:cytokine-like protein 1 n=1 Tax=Suncus etruscus TaxID=109475 RepID=UPI0021103489|nr:cytokine-like protein 1 [Suncus etruscus]
MPSLLLPALLPLLLLLARPLTVRPAPPTCYSRMLALSREITGLSEGLQAAESQEPCVSYLPRLYLDIHNYCVLARLRDFVGTPPCWHVDVVDSLRNKARKLYTIMTTYCRRDLVFLSDDCSALDSPPPVTTIPPEDHR